MSNEALLLVAIGVVLAGGVAGLLPLPGDWAQRAAVALFTAGSALGISAAARVLAYGGGDGMRRAWALPGAEFALRVDALSAWFLVPIFLIPGLGAWYGLDYWRLTGHPANARRLLFFYSLTTAAMALVVAAHSGIVFLVAWEIMAVSAFLLVATEDEQAEVRAAAWVYLVATHTGTLLLLSLFGLYGSAAGKFLLEPFALGAADPMVANAIFLLAVAGFGIKAGVFPLHVWLPPAHANAPSHVSALMSGVLIKMGIYGLLRITWLFSDPPLWWGVLLLALGVVSAVLGVAFALGQHDIKRLLAYHSIENIGIILIGLGMAVAGRAAGDPALIALGLAGALLHTWNHGLFKALLFFGAGAVLHRTHTREIDQLGGLAKPMPYTALFFIVGAAAICGLPPLNGFISELLIYVGLFGSLAATEPLRWLPAVVAIPALGLVGALAVACFVKAHGAVFLGEPRSAHARQAIECGPAMLVPMGVLAACCALIGIFPGLVAPLIGTVTAVWAPGRAVPPLATLVPMTSLTWTGLALVGGLGVGAIALHGSRWTQTVGTWDCGYALPTPRMQYTSSSFAQTLVRLWQWALLPVFSRRSQEQVFPAAAAFASRVPDTVLDRGILPVLRGMAWTVAWLRPLQQGSVNAYLFYVFLALFILLAVR